MEILYQFENWENYEKTAAVFDKLNGIVEEDKAYWLDAAKTFGREFANDEVFYVLGCGPLEGTAYSMANCHLIEMQTFAGRYTVIDAAESALYKVADPAVAEYFEPVVIWPIERMFVEQMAEVRGHSMDDRNYMWKFEY